MSTPPSEPREVSVSEVYSENGFGYDSTGFKYEYAYHVPKIEDDTPGAASINEEIADLYGALTEASLEAVKSKEPPGCNIVAYESYRSGDILCLVMKCAYYYGYFEEFRAYSYDTAKGVRLTNADVLARKGVSQEQYLYAVRCAAAKYYDDQYFPVWEECGFDIFSGEYQERRSWTLSGKNITLDLPLYLDDEGTIHTIAAIGCHTGVDWMYQTLTLKLDEDTAEVETEETLDYLTVTHRGREVTLRFNKTPGSAAALEWDGSMDDIPYGEELPVNGLYGDYTRIFCSTGGEVNTPYVFLLTREGRVEYVDVMTCLRYGYFCASGPLLGAGDVIDFSTDFDENGIQWVYAITGSGERIDLLDLKVVNQLSMDSRFTGSWSRSCTVPMNGGGSYEEYELLDLFGCDYFDLTCGQIDQDEPVESNGYLIHLGMTEDGAVYAYRLWGRYSDAPGLTGVIALYAEDDYSGTGPTLYITELGGTPLFGEQTGDTAVLVRSYG